MIIRWNVLMVHCVISHAWHFSSSPGTNHKASNTPYRSQMSTKSLLCVIVKCGGCSYKEKCSNPPTHRAGQVPFTGIIYPGPFFSPLRTHQLPSSVVDGQAQHSTVNNARRPTWSLFQCRALLQSRLIEDLFCFRGASLTSLYQWLVC